MPSISCLAEGGSPSISLKLLVLALVVAFVGPSSAMGGAEFILGVDANYALDMESHGARWKWDGKEGDLLAGIREKGAGWLRVRLWTGDDGVNGLSYATQMVERGNKAGLTSYLVIFLSENWADLTKQPAPAPWKNLSLPERADAIRKYATDVVRHFRQHGLTSHLYEIGNEIDFGICGIFPGKHEKKNPADLATRIWNDEADLILACQKGVKEADPEAKFLLHIAHWWDPEFATRFFQFMLNRAVQIDFAGLSYFPSANIGGSLTLEQFGKVVDQVSAAIKRPIIIPETAYPSTAEFSGQFEHWRNEVPGYPLTPEGQQHWLIDFLKFSGSNPNIAGVFYWSPEWYGEGMWKAFALFDIKGNAKPAWTAFRDFSATDGQR